MQRACEEINCRCHPPCWPLYACLLVHQHVRPARKSLFSVLPMHPVLTGCFKHGLAERHRVRNCDVFHNPIEHGQPQHYAIRDDVAIRQPQFLGIYVW